MHRSNILISMISILLLQGALLGACSSGITIERDAQIPPSHPGWVTAQVESNNMVVNWLGTGDDQVRYYQIYRRHSSDEAWEPIEKVEVEGDNTGTYEFVDTNLEQENVYMYGISAINVYSRESEITESPSITFQ
jgi:hypothetical protein